MQRIGFKIAKWIIIVMAVLQLALSQIHIKAISIMFAPQVGFYLFLFILFGLLLMFLMTSLKVLDGSSVFKVVLSCLASCGAAVYCIYTMWNDFKAHDVIKLADFQNSVIFMASCIAVYVLGVLIIIVCSLLDRREARL